MKRHRYLGVIGIISFTLATIQSMFIACYPMIGYLIFKVVLGSYSIGEYRRHTPFGVYLLTIVLFAVSIAIGRVLRREEETRQA